MDASCGPSSALNQFNKHSQRDTSLQNEAAARAQHGPQHFRNLHAVDARLNQEFQQFSSQNMDSRFQPQHHQIRHTNPQMGQKAQPGWVQDFGSMHLEDGAQMQNPQQHRQSPALQADWHLQFMKQGHTQTQQNLQNNQQHGHSVNQNYQTGYSGMNSYAMRGGAYQPAPQMNAPQQHQSQNVDMAVDFDSEFDRIERELQTENVPAEATTTAATSAVGDDDVEKEQFADVARQVKESMLNRKAISQETSAKIENSEFLKLMTSISERKVELNSEKDKLVERELGSDIREHLSDPLRHERATPDYHEPQFGAGGAPAPADHVTAGHVPGHVPQTQSPESSLPLLRLHLPDPLAHIRDGALLGDLTPLQAARIVSGGQVESNKWMEDEAWTPRFNMRRGGPQLMDPAAQEVYDDYRHDDTSF